MKIRNGFVSNSSSSSFVLLGAYVDNLTDEQIDILEQDESILEYRCDDDDGYCIGIDPNYIHNESRTIADLKVFVLDEIQTKFPELNVNYVEFVSGTQFD